MPSVPDTPNRLLMAAIDRFGAAGYEAVSTRELAAAANANVASIKYHYGGKAELYSAALEHIADTMAPRVEQLKVMLAEGRQLAGDDPQRQAQLVKRFCAAAVAAFLAHDDVQTFLPLVLREYAHPGPDFERIYARVSSVLHETVTELVAWIDGRDASHPDAILRAHALLGQIVVFRIANSIIARRLDDVGSDLSVDEVAATVSDLTLRSLGLPVAEESP